MNEAESAVTASCTTMSVLTPVEAPGLWSGPGLQSWLPVLDCAQSGVHAGRGRGVDRAEEPCAVEAVDAHLGDMEGGDGRAREWVADDDGHGGVG